MAHSAGAAEYTDRISAEGKTPQTSVLDMTLSNLMVELWGMRSIPLLPSFPGTLWPLVVPPDRVLCMGQAEQNSMHMLN